MPSYITDPVTGAQRIDSGLITVANRVNVNLTLADHAARITALEDALEDAEYAVSTFAELQAAVTAGATRVHLYDNITCTAAITLPITMTVIYRGKMLIDGGFSVLHYAAVGDMTREQKFSGFVAGDIRGAFGGNPVFPEWWGLTANYHDIAINCAVQASPIALSNVGLVVSLAAWQYDVSAPIDLTNMAVLLIGAGSGRTIIAASSLWTATWQDCNVWAAVSGGNHAAVIWMGGGPTLYRTFYSGVVGVSVNCYYATWANPTRRVSGISAIYGVEENGIINDVWISYASGFSIGFAQHSYHSGTTASATAVLSGTTVGSVTIVSGGTGYNASVTTTVQFIGGGGSGATGTVTVAGGVITGVTVTAAGTGYTSAPTVIFSEYGIDQVNGLQIENVTLAGPAKRDTYAMHFTQWDNNYSVSNCTVNMNVEKANSASYAVAGGFNTTVYSAPANILDWPLVGIKADGKGHFKTIHIEGCGIGLFIPTSADSTITVEALNVNHMMNRASGMVYYDDYYRQTITGVATYAAGTNTLLTVSSTTGIQVNQVIAITNANGSNASSYNTVHIVTAVPPTTAAGTIAINLAYPGAGAVATTAGNITWNAAPGGDTITDGVDYLGFSCAVLIGNQTDGTNAKNSVTLTNIKSIGFVCYLLRDRQYSKQISAFGHGQFPNGGTSCIAFYTRGNAFVNSGTAPYTFSSTSTTNFLGPII